MRRNRLVLLAAVCGALSLVLSSPARADLTSKTLKPVVGVKFGMDSALGSLLGGTLAGEVTQVEVKREEATKIVVTVSYTGFDGGKLWGEVTTSDRKTHRQIKGTSPRPRSRSGCGRRRRPGTSGRCRPWRRRRSSST